VPTGDAVWHESELGGEDTVGYAPRARSGMLLGTGLIIDLVRVPRG
jgi:hypothetical protein